MAAFAECASEFAGLGLAPIPTGGDDGKRPLMRDYNRTKIGRKRISQLSLDFGEANVAVVCGLSQLNVVDVDDPSLIEGMLQRFGDTPLITKTGGRGGYQLFYRAHKEVFPSDLRDSEGIEVEVKAQGNIVVVPPSFNWKTGRPYTFERGRLAADVLSKLPRFNIEALYGRKNAFEARRIRDGQRNDWLWRQCMKAAPSCDDFAALVDVARTRNDECEPALDDAEVQRVSRSAWEYTSRGENWLGTRGFCIISPDELDEALRETPGNWLAMLLRLRRDHGARAERGETFALVTRAMEEAGSYENWGRKSYRTAIEALLHKGYLIDTGKFFGRAKQYTLPLKRRR